MRKLIGPLLALAMVGPRVQTAAAPSPQATPAVDRVPTIESAIERLRPLSPLSIREDASVLSVPNDPFQFVFDRHNPSVAVGPVHMTALGRFGTAERHEGRVVYRADSGRSAMVYRPLTDGMKEDLVLLDDAAFGSGVFGWLLDLEDGLDARLQADGSIDVYRGSVRVARMPAPIAEDVAGRPLNARYALTHPWLSVIVARIPDMQFPVVVDPTVILTLDADFRIAGNDEGLARFATDQVHRDNVTGWYLPSWTSSGTFATARNALGSAVHDQYFYVAGGHNSGTHFNDVQFATINGDGTLGSFAATTSFPGLRRGHGCIAVNGYLYILGGHNGTSALADVWIAKLNSNGTISPGGWTAGPTIPNGGRHHYTAVAINGFIYIAGGFDGSDAPTNAVLVAAIRGDGTLSTWTATSTMNSFRHSHGVFAHDGCVYAVGGHNGSFALATSEFARTNPDGTLSSWTLTTSMPSAKSNAAATSAGGYAFVAGADNTVVAAPVLPGGGLGPWVATASLPEARDYPRLASANGRVFVAGGQVPGSSYLNSVHNALPSAGHVGPWSATTALPQSRHNPACATFNGRIYAAGGFSQESGLVTDTVYSATITSDGVVGPWSSISTLPAPRTALARVIANGRLYLLGGSTQTTLQATVHWAPINPDGTLGAWTATTSLPLPIINREGVVRHRDRIYVLGGNTDSGVISTVYVAVINADGSLGAWTTTTSLPNLLRSHAAAVVADRIYISGGVPGAGYTAAALTAAINADGSLGAWSPVSSLPSARAAHSMVAAGGHLYTFGGEPPTTAEVLRAPLNSDGSLGAWSTTASFPLPERQEMGVVVHNGVAYIIGGSSLNGGFQAFAHVHSARLTTHGTLGSWASGSTLPQSYFAMGAATYNNFIYAIGGTNTSSNIDKIYVAAIDESGAVGSWTEIAPYPETTQDPAVVAHAGFMYVGGGASPTTTVRYAPINSNGTLGAWQTTSSLPSARHYYGFVVSGGYLYAIGGRTGGGLSTNEVTYAAINANGTLGPWTATSTLVQPSATRKGVVAYDGRLYVIGGYNYSSGADQDYVQVAAQNVNGTLGPWSLTAALPQQNRGGAACALDGYLVLVGTANNALGSSTEVWAAPIHSTGALGPWAGVSPLQTKRSSNAAVIARNRLYTLGGIVQGPFTYTNTVEYTSLRTPATRATYSKLVDLGSDQSVTSVTTTFGGSNGAVTLSVRSATSASPSFGPPTTITIYSGVPAPYVLTARYLHLRYTLDDSGSVVVNPDSPAHLAIDDITISTTSPPLAPAALDQVQDDDFTPIAVGKGADSSTIFIHADVDDPDGDDVRLHVELKPVGVPFTNAPTASSSLTTSPNSISLQVNGLTSGTQYHWQAWVEDIGGAAGPKVSFGGNTDPNDVDLFIDQPPTAPTSMNQFESDGVTPIADGGSTLSSTVVLKGTRADPDALSLVKVQLEIQPSATPFTDTFTNESSLLAPGVQATFTLSGLVSGGYHWQMRCVDDNGKASTPWTPFSASATHFTVVANQPPDVPTFLLQFENDGSTPILFGDAAGAAAVKLQGVLSDPNVLDTVKLQIELRPTGVPFTSPGSPALDGVVFFENTLAAQGVQQVSVTIPADGTYHWQARTVDNSGAASVWTSAGGNNDPDDTDVALNLVDDPPVVTSAGQFQSDGATIIAVGGNATPAGVVFKATVTDPEAATVTLEIELRDTVTGLSASSTHTAGPFASGSTIMITATPALGDYHWAYRATDGTTFSAWTSFGGNTENPPTNPAAADFIVTANAGATASALAQFFADGTTPLPLGSSITGTSVVLQATVTDPEGQSVKLRVEVKPVGTAFDGASNLTESALVASGSTIQVTVPGLLDGAYHWQAIGVDVQAGAGAGVGFGGNTEADPDFRVDATNSGPTTPSGLGQYSPPGTVGIALGGSPFGRTVILKAATTDEELGQVAFEIEIQPVGTPFTNTRTHPAQLSFGSPGVLHSITLDGLSAGSYHWQIRAVDAQLQPSAWTSYGGNAETAADFRITATEAVPPNAPLNLKQRLVNDLVDIAPAATIAQAAVRLKAQVVHPRTEIVKLQIEVQPLAAGFANVVTHESDFVDSGSIAEVVVYGMPNDSYVWHARTVDSKGTVSDWSPYGGAPDFVVAVPVNNPPDDPPFVLQHQANGTSLIAVGAATTQSTLTIDTLGTDSDGDPVRLEVEIKPIGAAFDGTISGSTAFFPSGTYLYLRIGSLPDGRYHWRARLTDANGASSVWVACGGNLETEADFIVNATANAAPALAAGLQQLREAGTTSIDVGALAGPGELAFRSDASDGDATDLVRLEVEVRPIGEALTSVATHTSDFVPQGYVADALIDRFVFDEACHWQARVMDINGATSGWVEFGGNAAGETDFTPSSSIAGGGSKKTCGLLGGEAFVVLAFFGFVGRRRRSERGR